MVASSRSFFGDHAPRRRPDGARTRRGSCSCRDMLADGSLGAAIVAAAEQLASLGAAIDLALAEADIAGLDDPAVDAILRDLDIEPPGRARRARPDSEEPAP
ncbi:MAG: hypothetical protein ACTS3F_03655 [Phycisphaerales bacterium]